MRRLWLLPIAFAAIFGALYGGAALSDRGARPTAVQSILNTRLAPVAGGFFMPDDLLPPSTTTTTEPPTTTTTTPPVPSTPHATAQSAAPPASGDCANPVISEAVARRESGCSWTAYNPNGCGGRGCLGFYQIDQGHYAAVSPWNPNTSGACYDLSTVRWEPWAQTECAERLGPGAWG